MKRVGIITIIDYNNYGNRLQNFAVQEVLARLGVESETIVNFPDRKQNLTARLYRAINNPQTLVSKSIAKRILIRVNKLRKKMYISKKEAELIKADKELANWRSTRITNFKKFTKEFIHETNYTITLDSIPIDMGSRYDAFVVGSDQVWNPNFRRGSNVDFLTFAPENKRISLSASFGISQLTHECRDEFQKHLMQMASLSVRENSGAEIVRELTDRQVPVHIDPTLMLPKEKWLSISRASCIKPCTKYILTYFLGKQTQQTIQTIDGIAEKFGLDIVRLADFDDKKFYTVDPSEFIDLVHSAEIILTDSFHGTIFSILMEKPFLVFERQSKTPSMSSRITTLLSKFEFEDRRGENINVIDDVLNIDYSHVPQILKIERDKVEEYLVSALSLEKATNHEN